MIAISASFVQRKVCLFQKRKDSFFLQSSRRVDSQPSPRAYATGAHLRDLAPGKHRNVAAVASRWQHRAVFQVWESNPRLSAPIACARNN